MADHSDPDPFRPLQLLKVDGQSETRAFVRSVRAR
jgi:hypothetical protein